MRAVRWLAATIVWFPAAALAGGTAVALPPGPVEGATTVPVTLVALNDVGQPLSGLRWRPSASMGALEGCVERAPGAYVCSYTAPEVPARTTVVLEARAKAPDRATLVASTALDLVPRVIAVPRVTANPDTIILGEGEGTVTVEVPTAAPPLLDASFGTLDTITSLGDGRTTARYVPRSVNFPHVAIVSAVDGVSGQGAFDLVALHGKADFPVQAAPGSTVILRIGGREYGPVRANEEGIASVPVVVPPGVPTGTQVVVRDGEVEETEIDLAIPTSRRLHVLPVPAAVPASTPVAVQIAVATPDGSPDTAAALDVSATAGTVGPVTAVSPGLYEATWTPDRLAEPVASFLATIPGERRQAHSVETRVLPRRPASLEVEHDPIEGTGEVVVEALALDDSDNGVGGLTLTALGGETTRFRDLGVGRYRASVAFSPLSREQLVVVGTEPTGLPPATIALVSPRGVVAPGSALPVAVVALDRLGVPVPGVEVELSVAREDGRIEAHVTTGDSGVALARYRAGDVPAGVRIDARAGGLTGHLALAQIAGRRLVVPVVGEAPTVAAWRRTIGWIGDGVDDAPVVETPAVAEAAKPAASEGAEPPPVSEPIRGSMRLRGGGVGSTYTYAQNPIDDGGPLLEKKIVVGGPDGAGPATPVGFEVGARLFPAGAKLLGLDVTYRNTYYGVTAEDFDGAVAKDALQLARGALVLRAPLRVADDAVVHAGLRLGAEVSDFIYFTGSVEARHVEYATLVVPSLSIGLEGAVEAGRFFAGASLDGLMAYGTRPLGTRFDLHAGVDLTDQVFVQGHVGNAGRTITVVGTASGRDLGTLTDSQWLGGAAIGLRL